MKTKQVHKSRSERYQEVVAACIYIENVGRKPTVAAIAKYLGLSASSKLRGLVNEVAGDGFLHVTVEDKGNGWRRKYYIVNEDKLMIECKEWYSARLRETVGQRGLPFIEIGAE
jgi:hypothetical protein